MNTKHSVHKLALSITAAILAAGGAQAYEVPLTSISTNLPPVDFHGFISQGYLYSSKYNYLAGETTQGSDQFTEMGVNASWNPLPRTRIAVQGFDYDVGNVGQYDPFLDYALVEYTANDEVGLRAGRIRRPSGIYNSIQDIDLARTYVLLPQGMYDARWRDWSASLDGGELFGNIPLKKAGSLSYEAYAGFVNMSDNGGVARYAENAYAPFNVTSMDSTATFGAQLWYNTPLDGLRFGASFAYMSDFGFSGTKPIMPGVNGNVHVVGNVPFQQYSAEYVWNKWTFQAEYYTYDLTGYSHTDIPAFSVQNALGKVSDNPQTWYVAASRRINKLLEVGTYYTQFQDRSYASPDNHQNDAALSLRFDLKDWWIFKVEGHYITGTGLLRDNQQNPVRNDDGWFMLAVKTTFSF
jgi:hypothetical protein